MKKIELSKRTLITTIVLTLAALVAAIYFSLTLTLSPILYDGAQFTMLVSLLLFILSYCLFLNRVRGRIERNACLEAGRQAFLYRQTFWLAVATVILFLSFILCLVRICVVLLQSSSSSCLSALDGSVVFTFCVAVGLSIVIFIDAYFIQPILKRNDKKSEED